MPTGSLCAERNAIGIALASDITLKRQDIKMVAVYSAAVPYDPNKEAILCHPIESQTSTSYPISSGKGILIDDVRIAAA